MKPVKAILIAFIPYVVITFGLYVLSNALVAVGLYFTTMLLTAIFQKDKNIIKTIFAGWNWKEGLILSIISSFAGLGLFFIWPYLNKTGIDATEMLKNFQLQGFTLIVFSVYLIFFNPFFEEVFWRQILHTNTKADFIIDALFAGYHMLVLPFFLNTIGCVLAYFVLFVTSMVWRYIKTKNNGLSVPVLSHFIADFGIIIFVYFIPVAS
ncbi:MAG: CPBP family intramembrane metalloprotease [Bacteroidales bacterium]|nr:CPBP family intramembrane metalloprotease [Bacteroidales bacterium]